MGYISKDIKRFFQKPSWIYNSIPYNIDEIIDELEDSNICTPITLDTPRVSIVSAGRVGRDDIKHQPKHKRPYLPRKEYLQQRGNQDNMDHVKKFICEARGLNNRELHEMLRELHTGDPKKRFLCGPIFLRQRNS